MTSTGPTIYVQIHDGAFEDQEECKSNRDRSYNMPLEVWDIDTLDLVTCREDETPAEAGFVEQCAPYSRVA